MFAVNDWQPISPRVLENIHGRLLLLKGKKLNPSHYQQVRRAFERIAVRSHRLTTRGRPWVWKLKDEVLNYPGGPDEWWQAYKHSVLVQTMEYLNTFAVIEANQTDGPKEPGPSL